MRKPFGFVRKGGICVHADEEYCEHYDREHVLIKENEELRAKVAELDEDYHKLYKLYIAHKHDAE